MSLCAFWYIAAHNYHHESEGGGESMEEDPTLDRFYMACGWEMISKWVGAKFRFEPLFASHGTGHTPLPLPPTCIPSSTLPFFWEESCYVYVLLASAYLSLPSPS